MLIFIHLKNPMPFPKRLFQLFICFFLLLVAQSSFSQTDSIVSADSSMASESNEEALQDYLIQTGQPFACRAFAALVSHRDGYSSSMGRMDNAARVTQMTGGFQLFAKVNNRTTLGLTITGRRLMAHDRLASISEIFKTGNSHNSETYFRYLILQSRSNLPLKRNQLFISGNVLIPMSKDIEVDYNNKKNQDALYRQLNAQLVFFRKYSPHFSFNRGITAAYRITGKPVNKLVMRGFLLPVFQHRLTARVYFTASAELNALLVKPFFNNLFLHEKAGLLYYGPFGILYSFQYGYYALGKNANAQHSFNVSLKREFKSIPLRRLRTS